VSTHFQNHISWSIKSSPPASEIPRAINTTYEPPSQDFGRRRRARRRRRSSTDTAASLRAAEIDADIIMKATMVDGVYDSDPKKNPDAVKFDNISFMDVLNKDLQVMDSTAASLCKDNNIPILVFSINEPENIVKAVCGESIGTLVTVDC
jgi:hypothetical protein